MHGLVAGLVTALVCAAGFVQPASAEDSVRYRGSYTWGHEVDAFCPHIDSQCYWLSPDTPTDVRSHLRQLSQQESSAPYSPVCVIVEAVIDRDSPRQGFAADYDGLVTVTRLFGGCADAPLVIESDLQHHRWILERIDGEALPEPDGGGKVPELDFGEKMTVTGNTGCNRFSGVAVLRDGALLVESVVSTRRLCTPFWNDIERRLLTVFGGGAAISIDADGRLVLDSTHGKLVFRLQDHVAASLRDNADALMVDVLRFPTAR